MEFDLSQLSFDKAYTLLNGIVVPRPIAWITTLNAEGQVNAAPYSAFNVLTRRWWPWVLVRIRTDA